MLALHLRRYVIPALLTLVVAACSGGGQQSSPPMNPQTALPTTQAAQKYQLTSSNGVTVSLSVGASPTIPSSAITFSSGTSSAASSAAKRMGASSCPSVPSIQIQNPYSHPITINTFGFVATLPCLPQGTLFGVTIYQIVPMPSTISPTKIGDASVSGCTITFDPTVQTITLPANTTWQVDVLPETNTAEVAFPVAPGTTTNLTAIPSNLPKGSALTFTYTTATGEPIYSAACFSAFNGSVLATPLQGVPLVGVPSFYCQLTPVNGGTITFGQTVVFNVTLSKSDRAVFEADGQSQGFACSETGSCNVPQFTVPTTYQTFILGNVQDLRLCVPASPSTDCNGVDDNPQGGSAKSVPSNQDFQVLVADDPTYHPGNPGAPVPWSGAFTMSFSGPCQLSSNFDNNLPPGYNNKGAGPNAGFNVTPTGTGTCVITTTEDPKYIVDYTNPSDPQPRSTSVSIQILAACDTTKRRTAKP